MENNLELYKVFYYVVTTGSLTKASEMIHISQPAITKHIKNLESTLNASLMIRTKKGIILTPYGEKIFEQVKDMMICAKNIDNITHSLADISSGTIRIGASKSIIRCFIIPTLTQIKKTYPHINVELEIRPSVELRNKLKNGEIDLIVSKLPNSLDEMFNHEQLGTLHDILITSDKYPELLNRKVKLSELDNYPFVIPQPLSQSLKQFTHLLKEEQIKPKYSTIVGSFSLIAKFVEEGHGIGFVTKEYIQSWLNQKSVFEIDITPKLSTFPYGIITLKNSIMSPATEKFIEYLRNQSN